MTEHMNFNKSMHIIYQLYFDKAFSRACYIIQDPEIAQKVVKEVFKEAMMEVEVLKNLEDFRKWLFATVKERALEAVESNKRSHQAVYFIDQNQELSVIEPADAGQMAKEKVILAEIIKELDEEYRHIILLRYYKDLSLDELAEYLGKEVREVDILLKKAKNIMMVELIKRLNAKTEKRVN